MKLVNDDHQSRHHALDFNIAKLPIVNPLSQLAYSRVSESARRWGATTSVLGNFGALPLQGPEA